MVKRKLICLVTTVCIVLTTVISGSLVASAGSSGGVYVKQQGSGYCTLASAVMMMRQKALNEGNSSWSNITQASTEKTAWISGQGLRHYFSYSGITVSYSDFSTGKHESQLLSLLNQYPEGVEIYDRGVPHAVFLTRYDKSTDTFYCADPALSTSEMKLCKSWLRTAHSSVLTESAMQDAIISSLDAYWYVSKYATRTIDAASTSTTGTTGTTTAAPATGSTTTSGTTSAVSNNTTSANTTTQTGTVTSSTGTTSVSGIRDDGGNIPTAIDPGEYFEKTYDFSTTSFADIDEDGWYYNYIREAYETGLMNGVDDDRFVVDGNVTIAQCITMAARIHDIYSGGKHVFDTDSAASWYDPYVKYAYSEGVIASKYTKSSIMNEDASRAEFAEIISGALPEGAYTPINDIDNGDITDVSENTIAGKAIYMLSRAGIVTGSANGCFDPDDSITRSQVAAILVRMVDTGMRVEK